VKKILIEQKRVLIDEIYSKYCEILPESELLTLDIIERILDYIELDDSPTVKDLFGDDFSDILTKEKITINDLLLINYYEHASILLKEFGESIFINRINLKDFLNS